MCVFLYSVFTSDDQPRVKGPRTRGRDKNPASLRERWIRQEHLEDHQTRNSLRTVPEEGEATGGGGVGGKETRSTSSGSKDEQHPKQFPTSRGLVSRPVRFA